MAFNFASIIPALISGGTSLLGGLLDPPKSNKGMMSSIAKSNIKRINNVNIAEAKWNRMVERKARNAGDFMMKEAERLGFNPVTYLQAGGLQHAYNVATIGLSKPAFHYYERDTGTLQQSGTTTGQAIGNALQAAGSSYIATQQQIQQNELQKELMGMQLEALNRQPSGSHAGGYSGFAGGIPSMTSTHRVEASTGALSLRKDGSVSLNTGIYGPLQFPNLIKDEDAEAAAGETVGPFIKPIVEGPEFLQNPNNQPLFKQSARDWWDTASQFATWAGKVWYSSSTPNAAARRVLNETGTWLELERDKLGGVNPNKGLAAQ